jgi:mutator protein MutT
VRFRPQVQALPRYLAASERLSPDNSRPAIHVVAAAVIDAQGRVLIAQRPMGKHLAGGWEFPGGKLEAGEKREAGLARELREELGITIAAPRPLIRVSHAYPTRKVLLDMWVITRYQGEPRGLDGQALRWCAQEDLPAANLLPADKPIVAALRLPERLTEASSRYYSVGELSSLEPREGAADGKIDSRLCGVFCSNAQQAALAANAGADFLVLDAALSSAELTALCRLISRPVYTRGLASEEAWALGASGINEITD